MKRYLSLILILGSAVGIYLLRFDPKPMLVEGIVGQPVNLNPVAGPTNEIDSMLEALLFRSLFKYDASGEIIGDLAESYQTRDGKIYEIKIKENLFWHDGWPITANDVSYTFSQDTAFANVKIEVVGEKTVLFELKDPLASFLSILTRPIAPSHLGGKQSPLLVIGSGDFKVLRVSRSGGVSEIVLQNLGKGVVEKIVLKFFNSQADLEEAARRGEVDAFIRNPVTSGFNHPSFTEYSAPLYGQYFALFFNLESKNELVKNPDFRKAAARKVPFAILLDEVLGGGGSIVRGPLSGTWAEAKFQYPEFSPNLREGYSGAIALTVPNLGQLPEVAAIIAEHWRELGIETTVLQVDPLSIEEFVKTKSFEVILLGQEVDRDPDRYNLWHSTQKDYPGLNIASYADPRADRALEEGRKAMVQTEREKHYLHFQQLFLEDNPAIFLYHPHLNYFVSRKFSGVNLSVVFTPAERFWNIQEWRRL